MSTHCGVDDLGAVDPQDRGDLVDERSSTGPVRISGGAANASPSGGAAHRHEARGALLHDGVAARRRPASQAWQVPSVGWPANGSSATGVKMRTR